MNSTTAYLALFAVLILSALPGCACSSCADEPQSAAGPAAAPSSDQAPPPNIQAWMDRLTVDHAYDPQTGFIVAREVIALPPVLADAPPLDDAVALSTGSGRPLIVFATADRCAPCQQYKRDALTDPLVTARLNTGPAIATHIEVDRDPGAADRHLGGRAIPMTYLLRDGTVVATLRGQRSASDLLEWLNEHNL